MDESAQSLSRRHFIRSAGSFAAAGLASARATGVYIALDSQDRVGNASVRWAVAELKQILTERGLNVILCETAAQASSGSLCIVAAGSNSNVAGAILSQSRLTVAEVPEALAVVPARMENKNVLLVCGHDSRGLVYGLLDLADRVQNSGEPLTALMIQNPFAEQPSNTVRSVTRLFTSDVEDKPWYNDREMWPRYLSVLATQRFNRFNLALGIGYDFIRRVTDAYFLFSYPFLLSVPGYNVHSPQLPDSERDSNLRMLKFISEQTVARGMEFQLGLWMHGYEWIDSPKANYTIEGITKENHGHIAVMLCACYYRSVRPSAA